MWRRIITCRKWREEEESTIARSIAGRDVTNISLPSTDGRRSLHLDDLLN
jgi:hypothetical protein